MSHAAWAKAQPGLSVRASAVLRSLADYADVDGYTAVLIRVLKLETSIPNDRAVQRALEELREKKLLFPTPDFKTFDGRRVPLHRLAIERGPQNTKERLLQERAAARAAAEDTADGSTGDTGVTPSATSSADGCPPCHPTGDTRVTPRVTPVSPKEKGKGKVNLGVCAQAYATEAEAASAAFDRVVRRWSEVATERVSPELDAAAWRIAAAAVDPERLANAALRYLAEAGEVKRGRCMALHRWLSQRKYEAWLARAGAASGDLLALAARFPDASARERAVGWLDGLALDGEAFVRAYLDHARLDGRVVTPRTATARSKLLEHPRLWAQLELTIGAVKSAAREGERASAAAGAGGR